MGAVPSSLWNRATQWYKGQLLHGIQCYVAPYGIGIGNLIVQGSLQSVRLDKVTWADKTQGFFLAIEHIICDLKTKHLHFGNTQVEAKCLQAVISRIMEQKQGGPSTTNIQLLRDPKIQAVDQMIESFFAAVLQTGSISLEQEATVAIKVHHVHDPPIDIVIRGCTIEHLPDSIWKLHIEKCAIMDGLILILNITSRFASKSNFMILTTAIDRVEIQLSASLLSLFSSIPAAGDEKGNSKWNALKAPCPIEVSLITMRIAAGTIHVPTIPNDLRLTCNQMQWKDTQLSVAELSLSASSEEHSLARSKSITVIIMNDARHQIACESLSMLHLNLDIQMQRVLAIFSDVTNLEECNVQECRIGFRHKKPSLQLVHVVYIKYREEKQGSKIVPPSISPMTPSTRNFLAERGMQVNPVVSSSLLEQQNRWSIEEVEIHLNIDPIGSDKPQPMKIPISVVVAIKSLSILDNQGPLLELQSLDLIAVSDNGIEIKGQLPLRSKQNKGYFISDSGHRDSQWNPWNLSVSLSLLQPLSNRLSISIADMRCLDPIQVYRRMQPFLFLHKTNQPSSMDDLQVAVMMDNTYFNLADGIDLCLLKFQLHETHAIKCGEVTMNGSNGQKMLRITDFTCHLNPPDLNIGQVILYCTPFAIASLSKLSSVANQVFVILQQGRPALSRLSAIKVNEDSSPIFLRMMDEKQEKQDISKGKKERARWLLPLNSSIQIQENYMACPTKTDIIEGWSPQFHSILIQQKILIREHKCNIDELIVNMNHLCLLRLKSIILIYQPTERSTNIKMSWILFQIQHLPCERPWSWTSAAEPWLANQRIDRLIETERTSWEWSIPQKEEKGAFQFLQIQPIRLRITRAAISTLERSKEMFASFFTNSFTKREQPESFLLSNAIKWFSIPETQLLVSTSMTKQVEIKLDRVYLKDMSSFRACWENVEGTWKSNILSHPKHSFFLAIPPLRSLLNVGAATLKVAQSDGWGQMGSRLQELKTIALKETSSILTHATSGSHKVFTAISKPIPILRPIRDALGRIVKQNGQEKAGRIRHAYGDSF